MLQSFENLWVEYCNYPDNAARRDSWAIKIIFTDYFL